MQSDHELSPARAALRELLDRLPRRSDDRRRHDLVQQCDGLSELLVSVVCSELTAEVFSGGRHYQPDADEFEKIVCAALDADLRLRIMLMMIKESRDQLELPFPPVAH